MSDADDDRPSLSSLDLETLLSVMRAQTRGERLEARQEGIEAELRKEMAASFGRANDKVAEAIERVVAAGRVVDAACDAPSRERALVQYKTLREAALRARWELRVHRDALGLPWNAEVAERTRVPGPRS